MGAELQSREKSAQKPSFTTANARILQRKCDGCREKEKILQRSAISPSIKTVPPITYEALRSPGQPLDAATHAFTKPRFMHDFSHVPVHSKSPASIQAKLTVSTPGDIYEQEADRIANQVMAQPANTNVYSTSPSIQRFSGQMSGGVNTAPASVDQVLASSGRALEPRLRQDMEQRFGHDFSRVRVHTDTAAEKSARDVNAHAYTVGNNVVFGQGKFAPGTRLGQQLIAHELTHVVQQGRAGTSIQRKTEFHPGVMHNHKPSGKWAEVQADPNSGTKESLVCSHFDPIDVMRLASFAELRGKWIAIDHLKWFFDGKGADFVEDSNLKLMLRTDSGVQAALTAKIPTGKTKGTFADHLKIEQSDYNDEEFQYAFGAIDRLDFEVDFAAGTIHAWFQDRYEWHPVYPFYSKFSDDVVRETNCVHAAAVELKSDTARDYWMKGETTIPLSALQSAASRWKEPKQIY
jgi:hypothetical protein